MVDSDSTPPKVDERFAEYCRRVDAGQSVDRVRFLDGCEEESDEVAELLEVADLIETMAGPPLSHGSDDEGLKLWSDTTAADNGTRPDLAAAAEPPLSLPYRIGDYELTELIGSGGMGLVYKARQLSLDRWVAVKTILAGRHASPEERARFRIEARAAGRLHHPNIVAVHEVLSVDGHDFYSMALIEGRSLNEFLGGGGTAGTQAGRRIRPRRCQRHSRGP